MAKNFDEQSSTNKKISRRTEIPKLAEEQTEALHQTLMRAKVNFDLWEGIREAHARQETLDAIKRFNIFFTSAEHALFDSFVVLLYSLFETRSDTVSISTLLRTLDSSLNQELQAKINLKIKATKPIWIKIVVLRNEVVGHRALNHSPADSFAQAAITPDEVRVYIEKCQHILGLIASAVFKNSLAFNIESKPCLDNLFTELRDSLVRRTAGIDAERA